MPDAICNGIPHCRECGSIGSIVEMGKCCAVFRLKTLDETSGGVYFSPALRFDLPKIEKDSSGSQNR